MIIDIRNIINENNNIIISSNIDNNIDNNQTTTTPTSNPSFIPSNTCQSSTEYDPAINNINNTLNDYGPFRGQSIRPQIRFAPYESNNMNFYEFHSKNNNNNKFNRYNNEYYNNNNYNQNYNTYNQKYNNNNKFNNNNYNQNYNSYNQKYNNNNKFNNKDINKSNNTNNNNKRRFRSPRRRNTAKWACMLFITSPSQQSIFCNVFNIKYYEIDYKKKIKKMKNKKGNNNEQKIINEKFESVMKDSFFHNKDNNDNGTGLLCYIIKHSKID